MKIKILILIIISQTLVVLSHNVNAAIIYIENIQILESSQKELPDTTALWKESTLPFGVTRNQKDIEFPYFWIKFPIEKPEDIESVSLYFSKFQFDLKVFFNSEYIGGTHAPKGKRALGWHHPLLVDIQNANWIEGPNQVAIRLNSGSPTTLLSVIRMGDSEVLKSTWKKQKLLHQDAAQISIFISFLAAIISFVIWLYRRKDTHYLFFSLFAAAWIVPLSSDYFSYTPFSDEYYFRCLSIFTDISALFLFLLINRALELELNKLAKTLALITFLTSVILLFIPVTFFIKTVVVILAAKLLVLMFSLILVFRSMKNKPKERAWGLGGLVVVIPVFIHDLYPYIGGTLNKASYDAETYSRHLVPIFTIIFLSYLIKKFVHSLSELETLNLELENRVLKTTGDLEKSYHEKREYELREAEYHEKQRIYKDLHDDVGSKLVSIIHSSNEDAGKSIARSALEYLRNSVSEVQNTNVDLSKTLDQICEETQIRCTGAGLEASTKIVNRHDVLLANPTPNLGYHLSRIIREGITNIIKHAHASSVYLEVVVDEGSLLMRLSDNGESFQSPLEHGIGTSNMQYRTDELGASINWVKNSYGGCDVIFELKFPP